MLQTCLIHSVERLVFCKALEQDSCTFESGHPALPGTQSWAHRARSTKPRAQSWEHAAGSMEPGAQNRAGHMDLGTQSKEHSAKSRELGAQSWEHHLGLRLGRCFRASALLCSLPRLGSLEVDLIIYLGTKISSAIR